MIDVQAADAPGLFAAPAGVSFGLLRPGTGLAQSVALSDAGGGAGTWSVSAPGLDAPATIDLPAGGAQILTLTLGNPNAAAISRLPRR